MFENFQSGVMPVPGGHSHYVTAGSGPAVLLLHGFPQTHAMWHMLAPALAENYTVVASDLRGYGASSKPDGTAAYSFREMARDQFALMRALGHERFHIAGHDRGGRVAHRLALDAPEAVLSLTLMDIVPTYHLLSTLNKDVATAYYHWFFLPQPAPFPEQMIGHDPDAFFESCLLGWGAAKLPDFAENALAAYREAWRDPDTIRGMCADYRAAIAFDYDIDAADCANKIAAPALVLYGADGAMARAYDVPGTWRGQLLHMQQAAIPGGHFFVDQSPQDTLAALRSFLNGV